jgi:hypothetical protein
MHFTNVGVPTVGNVAQFFTLASSQNFQTSHIFAATRPMTRRKSQGIFAELHP